MVFYYYDDKFLPLSYVPFFTNNKKFAYFSVVKLSINTKHIIYICEEEENVKRKYVIFLLCFMSVFLLFLRVTVLVLRIPDNEGQKLQSRGGLVIFSSSVIADTRSLCIIKVDIVTFIMNNQMKIK